LPLQVQVNSYNIPYALCRTSNRETLSMRHSVAPYKFLKAHPGGVKFKSPPGWVDLRGVPDPTWNKSY